MEWLRIVVIVLVIVICLFVVVFVDLIRFVIVSVLVFSNDEVVVGELVF